MNMKRKQDNLMEHIRNIINAYEDDEIGTRKEGEGITEEETVKLLIEEQVDYYLTRR